MPRVYNSQCLLDRPVLATFGLNLPLVGAAISYVYDKLDSIDSKLTEDGGERLSELLELANLSSVIGNLFRSGIVKSSGGKFSANAPHTYPDLLGSGPGCCDIEIKTALEDNSPKGHLAKPGPHITVRYVLCEPDGKYTTGKRGTVVWIWEVRVGTLQEKHFNISNTAGDSGKTAVINAAGLEVLELIYFDIERCPFSPKGSKYKALVALFPKK
jgi:hypothetical protein